MSYLGEPIRNLSRRRIIVLITPLLLALRFIVPSASYALDVELTIPTVLPLGILEELSRQEDIDFNALMDQELAPLIQELERQIENSEEVRRFTDLRRLTRGFANAGAATAHLGTPRAFSDYRSFAFVLGTGAALAAPKVDPSFLSVLVDDIESTGDLYAGVSTQPLSANLGINLNRWLVRTRGYVKFGYFNLPSGLIAEDVSFTSLSAGAGLGHQLLRTRQLPYGFLRWRGLTVSSGVLFQRSETTVDIQVAEKGFTPDSGVVTFGDLGFTNQDFNDAGLDLTEDTEVGTIRVAPTLTAAIESRSLSVPLEFTTGVRLFYLLDLNVGGGVDFVFGSSELTLGATADAEFAPSDAAASYLASDAGSARFSIRSRQAPDFARPRVTAGAALNLGSVKLDIPAMLYFDSDGYTLMAGVNLAIVW